MKTRVIYLSALSVSFSPIWFARQLTAQEPKGPPPPAPPIPFYMNLNEVIIGLPSPVDIVVDGCQYYCPRYYNRICMLLFMAMYLFISAFSHPFRPATAACCG